MKESQEISKFNQLYKDYNERFIRFAKTYVYSHEIAEDIVMDSFMYYWENRVHLETDSNIPAYLLTVIRNKCLNYLMRLRTRQEIEDYLLKIETWELNIQIATLEACNPEKLLSDEIQQIVEQTLLNLPKQTMDIFIRSRFKNQTNKEIAEELGLSVKSIEYHITKSLKFLRIALKDYFPLFLFLEKLF